MPNPHQSNIGAFLKVHDGASPPVQLGNVPAAASAGTRNSAAIPRGNFQSCKLNLRAGATTGTPTSFTADAKIQDSADGSTGWADYTPPPGPGSTPATAAVTQITAASKMQSKDVDLATAKAFIRVVETVAFVGGTTPTLAVCSDVVLGGSAVLPAV